MKNFNIAIMWLVVIGAVNWGLAALNYDLVKLLFSSWPSLVTVIYLVIGAAGVYQLLIMVGTAEPKKKSGKK